MSRMMRQKCRSLSLAVSLLCTAPAFTLVAAQSLPVSISRQPDSLATPSRIGWVTPGEWRTMGTVAAATALLLPLDRPIARHFDRPSHATPRVANVVSTVAEPAILFSTVALVGIGRLTQHESIADIGVHGSEALFVSAVVTGGAKRVIGRLRPHAVESLRSMTFEPFSARDAARSFPSGHTTLAFSLAAVLDGEIAGHPRFRRDRRARWLLASVLYGSAAAIGAARLAESEHWISDLAAGAGVGVLSARWTVRHRHARGANRLERWLTGAP